MKIVVGFDGSNAAMDALKLAVVHGRAFQGQLAVVTSLMGLSLIHISEPTRQESRSRMPSSA